MKKTNFTLLKGLAASALMAFGLANANAQLSCQDHVNVSLSSSCAVTVDAATFSAGTPAAGALVTIKNGTATLAGPLASITVSNASAWVGNTYTFEVSAGGNKCWGTVKFEDKLGPVFTCPAPAAPGGSPATAIEVACNAAVPTAGPAVADCSAITSNTYSDVTAGSVCAAGGMTVARTWTAVDKYGNTSACTVYYKVVRPAGTLVTYPAVYNASACSPLASAYGPDVAGWPSYNGGSLVSTQATSAACQFSATTTDKVAPTACGIKIVRTWVIIDWCTGSVIAPALTTGSNPQIITVEDRTAPVAAAAPAITISTSVVDCFSDALVAPPATTDNCSAAADITYTVTLGTSSFPVTVANGGKARIKGLPILPSGAAYAAVWTIKDKCGNTTTVNQSITVADLINPTAVCDQDTKVALTQTCQATVNAITFDDGSLDNCCLDVNRFEVARAPGGVAGTYAPTITFNKADCGVVVMVALRVWDCNGNSNVCMVNVTVEDKIAPVAFGRDTIVCCGSTPTATAWLNANPLTEKTLIDYPSANNPGWYDNCGADAKGTIGGTIDNCGNGTVTRAWTVTDKKVTTLTATANVRYISENRSAYTVEFPADVTLTCNDNKTYATSSSATGTPKITTLGSTCPLVGVESADETFKVFDGNGCYKIIRTWKVLNWCQPMNLDAKRGDERKVGTCPGTVQPRVYTNIDVLRPDRVSSVFGAAAPCRQMMVDIATAESCYTFDTDGYMEYKQVILVNDIVAPSITAGATAVEPIAKDCRVKLTIGAPKADDCTGVTATSWQLVNSSNVIATSGSTFPGGVNFGGTGELAFGNYTVRYIATDKCGNFASTDVAVTIKDAKKPTPICFQGLSIDLMPTSGNVMVNAKTFDAGSYDNCPGTLTYKIQTPAPGANASYDATKALDMATFSCVGLQTVALWVGDAAGNWDYCETYIEVQNNMGAPNVPNCPTITPTGSKVAAAVKTEAGNPAKANVTVEATGFKSGIAKWTQANGVTEAVFAPANADVKVTAENNTNPMNGVSTLDLVLISKHILGTQPIVSNYGKVAADVNNNGTISTADLVELRKMILGLQANFSNNKSWKMLNANMSEVTTINAINADATVEFTAVKIGDINGNADATAAAGRSTVNFNVADATLTAGQEVKVVLNNKSTEGFQFALNFDASALEVVAVDENSAVLENGTITTAQVGTEFAVVFKAKKNTQLSNVISLGSAIAAEAVVNGASANVAINFNNSTSTFELAQNQPNPFRGATVVSFSTPVEGAYTMTITDMAGRTVQSTEGKAVKGLNNVTVNIAAAGIYNYTVKTSNFTATKKMVVIE
jgi:Secretion system C-terminal sorting domain/Dockerin type I domain